jgi:hypothetical protein
MTLPPDLMVMSFMLQLATALTVNFSNGQLPNAMRNPSLLPRFGDDMFI